jgi:hypothetical protein
MQTLRTQHARQREWQGQEPRNWPALSLFEKQILSGARTQEHGKRRGDQDNGKSLKRDVMYFTLLKGLLVALWEKNRKENNLKVTAVVQGYSEFGFLILD